MKLLIIFFLFITVTAANAASSDTTIILKHFDKILGTSKPRNCDNIDALNQVAAYIHSQFALYGDSTVYQEYKVGDKTYKNVITSFGPKAAPRIIVGAHYDVCGEQDGADDNASGVVGLLELARLLNDQPLTYRIDVVAYTLEEPPYFSTPQMGSFVHAQYLDKNNIEVYGMVCLEMIGYFSDEKKSQRYPLGLLKLFYGGKGDYITVVKKMGGGKFAKHYKRKMKNFNLVETKSITAPAKLRGIDFSDHRSYWKFDYSAVMITNTGFYRNLNYHHDTDVLETLDINRMAAVIDEVFMTLQLLQREGD